MASEPLSVSSSKRAYGLSPRNKQEHMMQQLLDQSVAFMDKLALGEQSAAAPVPISAPSTPRADDFDLAHASLQTSCSMQMAAGM